MFDVKLAGFGKALWIDDRIELKGMCGTVGYMAPEMLASGSYDKEIDLWCMGVVLYSLIAGELPFHEETFEKTNERILSKEPDYNLIDKCGFNSAKPIVKGLLTKNPKKRMNVKEVLNHRWLENIDEKGEKIPVRIRKNSKILDFLEDNP